MRPVCANIESHGGAKATAVQTLRDCRKSQEFRGAFGLRRLTAAFDCGEWSIILD
jgi:hypothetical protein